MKKLLNLLSVLTISSASFSTLNAMSAYEKEPKLSTNNFENIPFKDFGAVIKNFESNNIEVSTLKTFFYLNDNNHKVSFIPNRTEIADDFVYLINKFVKTYGLKTLNTVVKKISVIELMENNNYFMYSDLWPEWLFTLNKKWNVIETKTCGDTACTYNYFIKKNKDILTFLAIAFDKSKFINTRPIDVIEKKDFENNLPFSIFFNYEKRENFYSTNNKTNLHIVAHEFGHAFETYFTFKKEYRSLLKDGISLNNFFLNKDMYYDVLPSDYLITYLAKEKGQNDESWANKKQLAYSIITSKYAKYNYADKKESSVISLVANYLFKKLFNLPEYVYNSENNAEFFAEAFAYWILTTEEEKQTDNWKILNNFFTNEIKNKYEFEID